MDMKQELVKTLAWGVVAFLMLSVWLGPPLAGLMVVGVYGIAALAAVLLPRSGDKP